MKKRTLADATTDQLAKFVDEDSSELKMLNTRIDPNLIKTIKVYCAANDTTMRAFISEALIEKLKSVGVEV